MRWQWVGVAAECACSVAALGQAVETKLPAFEVATVRPVDPNAKFGTMGFLSYPGGKVTVGYATVRTLVYYAYDVQRNYVLGGPPWVGTEQ